MGKRVGKNRNYNQSPITPNPFSMFGGSFAQQSFLASLQASSSMVENDVDVENTHDPSPDVLLATVDSEPPPGDPSQDDEYFFENIVMKVAGTLFSVPKRGFVVEGSTFADMYKLPQPNDLGSHTACEGNSVDSPIELLGISVLHFRSLLRVMYPYEPERQLTYDDWLGALHLAEMWNLEKVRKRAIAHITILLHSREAITHIKLGKQFGVLAWLTEGYALLGAQSDTPNVEQLYKQGLDGLTIARIFCLRETVGSKGRYSSSVYSRASIRRTCSDCSDLHMCGCEDPFLASVRNHIPTIFQTELKTYDSL